MARGGRAKDQAGELTSVHCKVEWVLTSPRCCDGPQGQEEASWTLELKAYSSGSSKVSFGWPPCAELGGTTRMHLRYRGCPIAPGIASLRREACSVAQCVGCDTH